MKNNKRTFFAIIPWVAFSVLLLFCACGNSVSETPGGEPPITSVSIVGGAALGWGIPGDDPLFLPMNRISANVFEKTLSLSASLLMFSCDVKPSWGGRWFLPPDDGISLDLTANIETDVPMEMVLNYGDGGEGGPRWRIPKAAEYTVTLDIAAKTVIFTEVGSYEGGGTDEVFNAMWLIDCKDMPLPYAMDPDGDNWTITIPLMSSDHVKFNGEDSAIAAWTDSLTKWFCPPQDGIPALGTLPFNYGVDTAGAWKIVASGTYTITLHPKDGTVTFYSDSTELSGKLWLVNTKEVLSASDSWEMAETGAGSGVYAWEGVLSGYYKFCASNDSPLSYTDGIWFGPNVDGKAPSGGPEIASMGSDKAWQISYGRYIITLTPGTERVSIVYDGEPDASDIDELWVIGLEVMPPWEGGSNQHWDAPNNTARRMARSGDTFTWSYNFKQNYQHFRILCRDNGVVFYPNPNQFTVNPNGSGELVMASGQEYDVYTDAQVKDASAAANLGLISWKIGAGIQTITIDMNARKISFSAGGTPVDPGTGTDGGGGMGPGDPVSFFGTVTSAGWATGTALSQNAAQVYTWQGALSAGQLQFRQQGQNIGTSSSESVPLEGGVFDIGKNNTVFTIAAAGTYSIELNMLTNKVTFANLGG